MNKTDLANKYDADTVIETRRASNAKAAAINVAQRNMSALTSNPFFSDPVHQDKIVQVRQIAEKFFAVHNGVYVNHRCNKNDPFSVVKFVKPQFPAVSDKVKTAKFRKPLKNLGVEIVYSRRSKSYLFRVR
jgi:hypothetical protein